MPKQYTPVTARRFEDFLMEKYGEVEKARPEYRKPKRTSGWEPQPCSQPCVLGCVDKTSGCPRPTVLSYVVHPETLRASGVPMELVMLDEDFLVPLCEPCNHLHAHINFGWKCKTSWVEALARWNAEAPQYARRRFADLSEQLQQVLGEYRKGVYVKLEKLTTYVEEYEVNVLREVDIHLRGRITYVDYTQSRNGIYVIKLWVRDIIGS